MAFNKEDDWDDGPPSPEFMSEFDLNPRNVSDDLLSEVADDEDWTFPLIVPDSVTLSPEDRELFQQIHVVLDDTGQISSTSIDLDNTLPETANSEFRVPTDSDTLASSSEDVPILQLVDEALHGTGQFHEESITMQSAVPPAANAESQTQSETMAATSKETQLVKPAEHVQQPELVQQTEDSQHSTGQCSPTGVASQCTKPLTPDNKSLKESVQVIEKHPKRSLQENPIHGKQPDMASPSCSRTHCDSGTEPRTSGNINPTNRQMECEDLTFRYNVNPTSIAEMVPHHRTRLQKLNNDPHVDQYSKKRLRDESTVSASPLKKCKEDSQGNAKILDGNDQEVVHHTAIKVQTETAPAEQTFSEGDFSSGK